MTVRRIALGLALVVLSIVATHRAWADILRIVQRDEEASHILLVLPVFAWLLWTYRERLRASRVGGSMWALLIVAVGWGFWAFGYIKGMQVFWHFGAILLAVGAFTAVVGVRVLRDAWPAFLVLLFLMPVPGAIRQPVAMVLQNASAQLTQHAMMLLGQDIERSGNVLIVNGQEVGIAEACNGMRMVTMLVLVGYTFVFVHPLRAWVRVLLVALAVPLAIVCNLIRLVPTVYAYGYASYTVADQLHTWLGWAMVVVAYFMLMGVVALLRWLLLPVMQDPDARPRRRARRRPTQPPAGPPRFPWLSGAIAVVMLVGVTVHGRSFPSGQSAEPYHAAVRDAAMELPRRIGPWVGRDTEIPEAARALLRPNVMLSRRYQHERTGRSFELLLVQCADARDMEGHFPPVCYPAFGWNQADADPEVFRLDGLSVAAMSYKFVRQSSGGRRYGAWVTNIILLPQGRFATTMSEIRRLAGTYSDRFFGAAQVQLVFDDRWTESERNQAAEQVLAALRPLMDLVLSGSEFDPAATPTQAGATR
jgi:exosortase